MAPDIWISNLTDIMNSSMEVSSGSEAMERKREVKPGVAGPVAGAILYESRLLSDNGIKS